MQIGVKFRAYPTSPQKLTFAQWASCSRFIYNAKVGEDRYFRTFRRHSLQHTGHPIPNDATYAHLRSPATPWLDNCPSPILRNTINAWQEAEARYRQGLAGFPTKKRKRNQASITLTRELFTFVEQSDGSHHLLIGTRRYPFGELSFTAHRPYTIPNTIILSRKNADYFVSFSYETEQEVVSERRLLTHLQTCTVPELLASTTGYDRGVIIPVQASSGAAYDYTLEQQRNATRMARHIQDVQCQLAKQIRITKEQAKQAKRT